MDLALWVAEVALAELDLQDLLGVVGDEQVGMELVVAVAEWVA